MGKPKRRDRRGSVARLTTAGALTILATVISLSKAKAQQGPFAQLTETSTSTTAPLVVKTQSQPTAPAAETTSAFDAKFSAGITSDYNYRGYTLSNHFPSVSGNVEVDYNILFASVNAASVQMPDLSHFQTTDTVGLRRTFDKLTVETGGAIYAYPGGADDPSYAEVYVSPTYAVTKKLTLGVNVFYAPDYYRMGAWENYNSFTAKYEIGWGLSFSSELGHQFFGTTRATATSPAVKLPDYTYGNAGFSYVYKSLTFDIRYHATTLSRQACYLITGTGSAVTGSNGCDQAVIATLTWNAGLSDVKSALGGSSGSK
jgi:uncharacterized protein (TIGR02001 family)